MIYEHYYGKIPQGYVIDHINQNPEDDRLENLRVVNLRINRLNAKLNKNNTTGYNGIYKYKYKNGKFYWKVLCKKTNGKPETKHFPFTDEGLQQAIAYRKQFDEAVFKNETGLPLVAIELNDGTSIPWTAKTVQIEITELAA